MSLTPCRCPLRHHYLFPSVCRAHPTVAQTTRRHASPGDRRHISARPSTTPRHAIMPTPCVRNAPAPTIECHRKIRRQMSTAPSVAINVHHADAGSTASRSAVIHSISPIVRRHDAISTHRLCRPRRVVPAILFSSYPATPTLRQVKTRHIRSRIIVIVREIFSGRSSAPPPFQHVAVHAIMRQKTPPRSSFHA